MNRTVRFVSALAVLISGTTVARAQTGAPATAIPIRDNSFLIEEAYNQEFGVVQHISTFHRVRRAPGWEATFTQEWPAPNERHQLSYTVPVLRSPSVDGNHTGIGDVLLNYRFQVPMATGSRMAASPRLSVMLPTGNEDRGQGFGRVGLEGNLPFSIELSPWLVSHTNVGGRWTPVVQNEVDGEVSGRAIFIGQSLIWLVHPKFNVMLESFWARDQSIADENSDWGREFLVSPGVRAAFDLPSGLQIVPGVAIPIGVGPSDGERGVFVYLSFEHPFRKQ